MGLLKVHIRLLKARLKVPLKVLIRLPKARLKVLLKVLVRLLKARLKVLLAAAELPQMELRRARAPTQARSKF